MLLILNSRFINNFKIDSWTIAFAKFKGQKQWSFPRSLLQFSHLYFTNVVAQNPLKDFMLNFTNGFSNGGTTYMANKKNYGA